MNVRAAILVGVKARNFFGLSAETVMSEIPSLFSLWRSDLRPIEGRRSDQVPMRKRAPAWPPARTGARALQVEEATGAIWGGTSSARRAASSSPAAAPPG